MFKPRRDRAPFDPDVEMMLTEDDDGKEVRWETAKGFTLSWGAKDWGFGTISFHE